MGFVTYYKAEITADYSIPLKKVLCLCDKLAVEDWLMANG